MIYEVTMSQLEASVLFRKVNAQMIPQIGGLDLDLLAIPTELLHLQEPQLERAGYLEERSVSEPYTLTKEIAAIFQTFNELKYALLISEHEQESACIVSERYAVAYTVPEPEKITFTRMSLAEELQSYLDAKIVVMDSSSVSGAKVPIDFDAFNTISNQVNKAVVYKQKNTGIQALRQVMPEEMAKGFYEMYSDSHEILVVRAFVREKSFTEDVIIFQSSQRIYQFHSEQLTNYEIMPAATAEVRSAIDRLLRPMIECLPQ